MIRLGVLGLGSIRAGKISFMTSTLQIRGAPPNSGSHAIACKDHVSQWLQEGLRLGLATFLAEGLGQKTLSYFKKGPGVCDTL